MNSMAMRARRAAAAAVEDVGLHRDIERREHFIADQQIGLGDERAGDGDALALAARKLVGKARGIGAVEAHVGERGCDALDAISGRRPDISSGRARIVPMRARGLSEASGFWKMILDAAALLRRCASLHERRQRLAVEAGCVP